LLLALSACQTQPSLFEVYRGEWLWVAVFEEGEPFVGSVSISARRPGGRGVVDIGAGAWVWCEASGRCPYLAGDQGGMGTYSSGGERHLVVEFAEAAGFTKLIALDEDGVLEDENDEAAPALFAGPGRWYFYSGGFAEIGFAMVKRAEAPGLAAAGGGPRPFAAPDDLPLLLSRQGGEASMRLTQRALEHLASLLD
jgi:hypothetical protein